MKRKADALCTAQKGVIQQPALLFWRLFSSTLQEWGFKINEYEQCVENKIIKGKQCSIIWHVDDLKISHAEKEVVEDIFKQFATKFSQDAPLTTSRGSVLDCLGMKIDYCKKVKVTFQLKITSENCWMNHPMTRMASQRHQLPVIYLV